jgi:signal transduction histidine kinase
MPEIDGVEFIRRIRERGLKEQPAIIVLTAQTDEDTRRSALNAGARVFIVKPMKVWELLQRVRNALEIQILYRKSREFNGTLEARVEERTHELAVANRAKSEFLANMSHELRTPLNAILGFSEVIMRQLFGPGANEQYAKYASDIHASGQHLLAIINDILDLSKIDAGQSKLDESEVSVSELVHAATHVLLGDHFRQAELELVVDLGDRPELRLYVDARKLKQALVNLLSNALKFTPAGGKVTLAVLSAPEGGLSFVVSDTGIGIAAAHIGTVLSPFGQIESVFSRKHQGAGLGLPLARTLIELQGGRLTLTSEVGVGTVVTLRLPAERVVIQPLEAV